MFRHKRTSRENYDGKICGQIFSNKGRNTISEELARKILMNSISKFVPYYLNFDNGSVVRDHICVSTVFVDRRALIPKLILRVGIGDMHIFPSQILGDSIVNNFRPTLDCYKEELFRKETCSISKFRGIIFSNSGRDTMSKYSLAMDIHYSRERVKACHQLVPQGEIPVCNVTTNEIFVLD